MIKRLIIALTMFFCIVLHAHGESTDDYEEAKQLGNFISWQQQLTWNFRNTFGLFLEPNFRKSVVPLTGQWGVGTETQIERLSFSESDRTIVRQLDWTHDPDQPLALFGEKVGASPLYSGNIYRFGVHTGENILKSFDLEQQKNLRIKVYDLEAPAEKAFQPIYEEAIQIPLNKFKEGDELAKQHRKVP